MYATPTQLSWQHSTLQGGVFVVSTVSEKIQIALFLKAYQSSEFFSPKA